MRSGGLSSTAGTDEFSIFWLPGVISIGSSPLQQLQLRAALRRVQATSSPLWPTASELIVELYVVLVCIRLVDLIAFLVFFEDLLVKQLLK
jgi:hypothetical protein